MSGVPDVFVSYHTNDAAATRRVVEALNCAGISATYDRAFITEGQWRLKVEAAIDRARLLVVVISSTTGDSVEVENEFRRAKETGKLIVPALIESCAPPLYAASYHRISLFGDWEEGISNLVEAIQEPFARLRDVELSYLDETLRRFERADYAPMSGTLDSVGRDDDPVRFDDLVYRIVAKHGDLVSTPVEASSGSVIQMVSDIALQRRGQIALIGDPGAGKSTSLIEVCCALARAAMQDPDAPIPVLTSLRNYAGQVPLIQHIVENALPSLRDLASRLPDLVSRARVAFLLDGLNEVPGVGAEAAGIREVKSFVARQRSAVIVVTCRSVDYTPEVNLGLDTIRIEPLNPIQIRTFIEASLRAEGNDLASRLFWRLVGDDRARDMLQRFLADGGVDTEFWLSRECPERLLGEWGHGNWRQWLLVRDNPNALLRLARNPYTLSMITKIYRTLNGRLPVNRWQLFNMFVEVLILDEEHRHSGNRVTWIPLEQQVASLTNLAYQMRSRGVNSLDRQEAEDILGRPEMISLAASEKILEVSASISFTHQLLQEFFASIQLDRDRIQGVDASDYWPSDQWWQPTGWEEPTIFIAGAHPENPIGVLTWLRDDNPELAARCAVESGARIPDNYLDTLSAAWLPRLTSTVEPPLSRAGIGRALGRIGKDTRPGVTLIDQNGLPVIEWGKIPSGPFLSDVKGPSDLDNIEYDFWMSRYLITNAHFETFIVADGYSEPDRKYWSASGWAAKGNDLRPEEYTEVFRLPNHPRIGVSWYEATAFCNWLTERLVGSGQLPAGLVVRLPTEREWEKAARGTEGRFFPWGNEFDYDRCNVRDIRGTTAVGVYPEGRSPYGIYDMVGNAWSWCLTKWAEKADREDNSEEGSDPRCYRGGSWAYDFNVSKWRPHDLDCRRRYWIVPEDDRPDAIGFFVVVGPDVSRQVDPPSITWASGEALGS